MRKTVSVLLSLILTAYLAVPSFAEEKSINTEFSFNEYEQIEALQSMSEDELNEMNVTTAEVNAMSEQFDEALMERAVLPYEELKEMGYSDDSINILRKFASGEELSSEEIQAVSATCTGSIFCVVISKRGAYFYYEWQWDDYPIMQATDSAVVAWRAYGSDGKPVNVSVTNTSNEITYYVQDEFAFMDRGDEISTTNFNVYAIKFPVSVNYYPKPGFIENAYAKKGQMFVQIEVDDAITRDISYIKVSGLYCHVYVSLFQPSITVGENLDISITGATINDKIAGAKVKIGIDGSFEDI